jgi:hypothetical protein
VSPWQPGDTLVAGTAASSRTVVVGDIASDVGQTSTIFCVADRDDELLKLYRPGYSRSRLHLIAQRLRQAFEGSDVIGAFPLALAYRSRVEEEEDLAGYVMQRFRLGPDGPWSTFDAATTTTPAERLPLARRLISDMLTFHAHGLIIGDFSPGNLLFGTHGTIAWLDTDSFGIVGDSAGAGVPAPYGTPPWLAPEVVSGMANCSQESDVYVAGLLVTTLLNPGMHPPHRFERVGELDRDLNGRIADEDSWMLSPEDFKARRAGYPGVAALPPPLADVARALLTPHPISERPPLSDWATALANTNGTELETFDLLARASEPQTKTTVSFAFPAGMAPPPTAVTSRSGQSEPGNTKFLIALILAAAAWTAVWSSGFSRWDSPVLYVGFVVAIFIAIERRRLSTSS